MGSTNEKRTLFLVFSRGFFCNVLFNTASSAAPPTVSEDAGIEPRTIAKLALAVNALTSGIDLFHKKYLFQFCEIQKFTEFSKNLPKFSC
jgi:hypothetical protein